MTKKFKGFPMVLITLVIFSISLTGCQTRSVDSTPNDPTQDSLQVFNGSSDKEAPLDNNTENMENENTNSLNNVTQSPYESDTVKNTNAGQKTPSGDSKQNGDTSKNSNKPSDNFQPGSTPKLSNNLGNSTKTQSNSGNSSAKFTIDDYMTMNNSLEKFTAFVNRRSDFSEDEKKQIISTRASQLEITDQLMAGYKKILTKEEMDAYLVQPAGEALEAGMVPVNDNYNHAIEKIEKAKKSDTEIARLSKELDKVKGGILKKFVDKAQKEKSKLLGF